jgi:hypothetical protein
VNFYKYGIFRQKREWLSIWDILQFHGCTSCFGLSFSVDEPEPQPDQEKADYRFREYFHD